MSLSECAVSKPRVVLTCKLWSAVEPIVDAIKKCNPLRELCLEGFSYGVAAAERIGETLAECGSELKNALWSDMFVSRTKEEVPVALVRCTLIY